MKRKVEIKFIKNKNFNLLSKNQKTSKIDSIKIKKEKTPLIRSNYPITKNKIIRINIRNNPLKSFKLNKGISIKYQTVQSQIDKTKNQTRLISRIYLIANI